MDSDNSNHPAAGRCSRDRRLAVPCVDQEIPTHLLKRNKQLLHLTVVNKKPSLQYTYVLGHSEYVEMA